tara:strand:- start:176 stop:337 length:162 start_codon:yes stop_codon:yes gene_type:complete
MDEILLLLAGLGTCAKIEFGEFIPTASFARQFGNFTQFAVPDIVPEIVDATLG